ncbi:unnamed protein product, partial [Laminaria digitata]
VATQGKGLSRSTVVTTMASAGVVAQSTSSGAIPAAAKPHSRPSLQPPSNATVDEAWATVIALIDGFPSSLTAPQANASKATRSGSSSNSNSSNITRTATVPLGTSMSVLRAGGLVEVLQAYILTILDRKVRDEVAPHFWALLDADNEPSGSAASEGDHEGGETAERG